MKKRPISLLIMIFSLALFGSYHVYYYTLDIINNQKVEKYLEEEVDINNNPQEIVKKISNDNEDILGILEIENINLKKPFYHLDSKKNNVNLNVEVLKNSKMPDIDGGTLFLAAHSGDSYLGYFKNLDKLRAEDEIKIYYQNKKYTYVISSIYEQEKNGSISVIKNTGDTMLVLTTCKRKDNKQLIITSKLFKSEKMYD